MSLDCACDGCRGDYPAAVRDAWAERRRRLEDLRVAFAELETADDAEPLPEHVGGYRTSPRR